MSCSLCNIQWYTEIYDYHDNKKCHLYCDKIYCFNIILLLGRAPHWSVVDVYDRPSRARSVNKKIR